MGFSAAVSAVFSKYATFSGRAQRSEFWWFTLFATIVTFVAGLLDGDGADAWGGTGPIQLLVSLAILLPNLAVTVRRLHDTGKSGWRFLWTLIPLVGLVLLVVWCVQDSEPGANRFGWSPKPGLPPTW